MHPNISSRKLAVQTEIVLRCFQLPKQQERFKRDDVNGDGSKGGARVEQGDGYKDLFLGLQFSSASRRPEYTRDRPWSARRLK